MRAQTTMSSPASIKSTVQGFALLIGTLAALIPCSRSNAMDGVPISGDYRLTEIRSRQPVVAKEFVQRYAIVYDVGKDGETTTISPRSKYLDDLADNRPLVGLQGLGTPFSKSLPALQVSLQPLPKGGADYDEIQLEVEAGAVDDRPLPSIRTSPEPRNLDIENDGWGPLRDAKLEIGLTQNSECLSKPAVEASLSAFKLGDIDKSYRFRVPDRAIRDAKIKKVENNRICAMGYLSFGDGAGVRHRTPFAAPIRAGESSLESFMYTGGHVHEEFRYDVHLPAGKAEYVKRVPVGPTYRSGGSFELRLSSDRSASYRINVRAHATDGSLTSLGTTVATIVTPRSMRQPDLNPALYRELPLNEFAPRELSGLIRSITQNPDKPEKFLIHVTDDWDREGGSIFEDTRISTLAGSLVRLGMPHGYYCIVQPDGACRQSGPFYWPGNWTQVDRSRWHSPVLADMILMLTQDPAEDGDFSVYVAPEWKRLSDASKLVLQKELLSRLKSLKPQGKVAYCYRGVGETGCIERVEAD